MTVAHPPLLASRSLAAAEPPADLPALRRWLARPVVLDADGVLVVPRDAPGVEGRRATPGSYRLTWEEDAPHG